MKSIIRFLSLFLILTISFALVSCISVPDYSYLEEGEKIEGDSLTLVGEPKLSYEFDEEYGEYLVSVEGFVKNSAAEDIKDVFISFIIYDSEGYTLTLAEGYCYYLEKDATWRFMASGYTAFEPASFKLISLFGY